jgi:putative lipase involved disintegration of autophagic bodies
MNEEKFMLKGKTCFTIVLLGLFLIGSLLVSFAQGVNMPKTIIHHVTLKWKALPENATDADKAKREADIKKVFDDLQSILSDIKGVKNFWMKSTKVQPPDYSRTFVIEFENQAALDAYAKHPKKKAWADLYYSIRETSYNSVTTN